MRAVHLQCRWIWYFCCLFSRSVGTVPQRLVSHAEEVAYNDPPSGAAEQLILNSHLYRLLRHNKLSAFQRFVQQVSR